MWGGTGISTSVDRLVLIFGTGAVKVGEHREEDLHLLYIITQSYTCSEGLTVLSSTQASNPHERSNKLLDIGQPRTKQRLKGG